MERQESARPSCTDVTRNEEPPVSHASACGAVSAPAKEASLARETSCPSCRAAAAGASMPFVYAVGRIEPRFPRISVEKEFAQATGRAETAGLTDREVLHGVLSERQNRYLVRQMCWVLTIEGLETYLLQPRDPSDYDLLVEALRPSPRSTDVDAVIGARGPVAPADFCNGLTLPIVFFSQVYSFDVDTLIRSIPAPPNLPEGEFTKAAEELFSRIMQIADNTGTADGHRALNYLAVRYPGIYGKAAEQFAKDFSLTGVEVRASALSNLRKIAEVIFSYTHRPTDFQEKYFVRVDVSEEFPFLVTKLSPYYDR